MIVDQIFIPAVREKHPLYFALASPLFGMYVLIQRPS